MDNTEKNREEAEKMFLIELEKITRKTGVFIGGCGCCGSPYLCLVDENQFGPEYGYDYGERGEVRWMEKENA